MKKVYLLLMILIPSFSYAEDWAQIGNDGFSIECPDFISLVDGKYTVLNDCYGLDSKNPVIEKGLYTISEKKITFVPAQRESVSFVAKNLNQASYIIEKNKNQIILKSGSNVLFFKVQ